MSHTSYEFQIAISASAEQVWKAFLGQTNKWWLPDFRMISNDSVVTIDPVAGGKWQEVSSSGSLLWYTVAMITPAERTAYFVGHLATDFGGPATTQLKIAVLESNEGCLFSVADGITGNTSCAESLEGGWQQLFTDGLKPFVESI